MFLGTRLALLTLTSIVLPLTNCTIVGMGRWAISFIPIAQKLVNQDIRNQRNQEIKGLVDRILDPIEI